MFSKTHLIPICFFKVLELLGFFEFRCHLWTKLIGNYFTLVNDRYFCTKSVNPKSFFVFRFCVHSCPVNGYKFYKYFLWRKFLEILCWLTLKLFRCSGQGCTRTAIFFKTLIERWTLNLTRLKHVPLFWYYFSFKQISRIFASNKLKRQWLTLENSQ